MTGIELDTAFFRAVNGLPHFSWLDPLVLAVSGIQQTEACAALCAVFVYGLLFKKHKVSQAAIVLLLAFMFLDNLVMAMKLEFNRPRPAEALDHVHVLGGGSAGSSFPSSQAALAALLFTYIYLMTRKRPGLWFGILALVGFFRVYQGVHYPGDILGGWVLGAAAAFAAYGIHRFIVNKFRRMV